MSLVGTPLILARQSLRASSRDFPVPTYSSLWRPTRCVRWAINDPIPALRRFYMPTKIRPLHDRVIVKRTGEIEKTKEGIIIPDTSQGEAARRQGRGSGPRRL